MKNIRIIIENATTKTGITKKEIQEKLGMSNNGFYTMLRTNSIKAVELEKLAAILNLPINSFFENDQPLNDQPKVFLAFELSHDQEDKVLKMVMGKDFINLLKK